MALLPHWSLSVMAASGLLTSSHMDPRRPRRLALLCGIADYKQPYGNLPAVKKDLEDLKKLLEAGLAEDYRFDRIIVHLNEALTLHGLEEILDELQQEGPIDEVFFYLAGHGCFR